LEIAQNSGTLKQGKQLQLSPGIFDLRTGRLSNLSKKNTNQDAEISGLTMFLYFQTSR
jgi:hypothetical protein